MAKPATLPRWAETAGGVPDGNITEPNSGKKDTGFTVGGDVPTSAGLNWLLNTILQWLKWAGKGAPVDADDLATKAYVDGRFPAVEWTPLVIVAPATGRGGDDVPAFWKDAGGVIHLRGIVVNESVVAAAVATLPAGARPVWSKFFATFRSGGANKFDPIEITGGGSLNNQGAAPALGEWIHLAGVSYPAEA